MSNERISDKSLKFDWFFIGVTLTLMTFGVFLVYSATMNEEMVFYDASNRVLEQSKIIMNCALIHALQCRRCWLSPLRGAWLRRAVVLAG